MVVVNVVIFKRNGEVIIVDGRGAMEQEFDLFIGKRDQQDAVLAGVGVEDIGEAGRDDHAKSVIVERPGCMLARRSAAEVFAGDENLRALVAGVVDLEVRVLTPVVKKEIAVAGALDALQKLLGNDLIRINVRAVERHHFRSVSAKRFHLSENLFLLEFPCTNIGEVASDSCGCGHHGADEMRTAAASLASFKVAIAG